MTGEELFNLYCSEHGLDEDDVRAASWYKQGLINFADWLLQKISDENSQQ